MSNRQPDNIAVCYRRLIAAIVQQAIKDNAVWFLESPEVRGYCVEVGINADISHNAGAARQRGNNDRLQ